MRLIWTRAALSDVDRLRAFLAEKNPRAADAAIAAIYDAPGMLTAQPRIGARIEAYHEIEARRLVVGKYEIWYAVAGDDIQVMRVFHTREDR